MSSEGNRDLLDRIADHGLLSLMDDLVPRNPDMIHNHSSIDLEAPGICLRNRQDSMRLVNGLDPMRDRKHAESCGIKRPLFLQNNSGKGAAKEDVLQSLLGSIAKRIIPSFRILREDEFTNVCSHREHIPGNLPKKMFQLMLHL
jgi:hypothetical protein